MGQEPEGRRVRLVVVGAGNRGTTYARHAVAGGHAEVAAVADPDPSRREKFAREFGLGDHQMYDGWQALADRRRLADAAIVATQDAMRVEPVSAIAARGYQILLEKPMAASAEAANKIIETTRSAGVLLAVCHVLRYAPFTLSLRELIDRGAVGDIASVQHLEPVGWWHQAHSYVRGSWRREDQSSPMLLAKSVHDLDWLNHIVGRSPRRVSSFGGLYHFRPEQRPPGAGDRCISCAVEPVCPYSAQRLYLSCLGDPDLEEWPLSTVTDARTPEGVLDALRTGPYGRCVYLGGNDVVDHQVVSIEYEQGVTAAFTMTAFTPMMFRQTRIFGTHGYMECDGKQISGLDFRTQERFTVEPVTGAGRHGGGDGGLIDAFVRAVASGSDAGLIPPEESLAAHSLVWAAERARKTGSVVAVGGPADDEPPRQH